MGDIATPPMGYRVTRTDTATIFHDVPIFAECGRGDLAFDAEWVTAAVETAKQQERDGYLPPLHTRHHEPETSMTDAVRAAGVFRITRAAPLSFKGKRVLAIFADLIITDPGIAEDVGRMRYPYRSVEIFDPEAPPEINGLALLDHEAPYLQLPMLFAGEVEDRRDPLTAAEERASGAALPVASATSFTLNYSRGGPNPLLGCARRGRVAALLFRFNYEDDMTDKQKNPANFADGEDGEKDEGENMEANVVDVDSVVAAIEDGSISVEAMDRILAAIQAQAGGGEEPEEEVGETAPAPVPGAEVMRAKPQDAVAFAKLQGEVDALRAKDAARDAKDKREADVRSAMKRLEGKPLGADLEGKLVSFHKSVDGNREAFKAYVDALATTVGELPSDNSGANFSGHPNLPKVAMAYHKLGSEAVEKAAQFSREYQGMKGRMKASEESYVRINMRQLGFEVEESAA